MTAPLTRPQRNLFILPAAVAALLLGTAAQGAVVFSTGTSAYDDSDLVLVSSAAATVSNGTNVFVREPRATMQTFTVGEAFELGAINILTRRAVEGAAFTLTLRDFGNTTANFFTPAEVDAATPLATFNATITAGQAFGQTSGGPDATLDPVTTMTWTLASSVNLVAGRNYALVLDGTSSSTEPLVYQYALGNNYAGGLGYLQDFGISSSENFRSGNDYFAPGNNQQADWSLALVAIPEPASLALMGLGGLLILGRTRRA